VCPVITLNAGSVIGTCGAAPSREHYLLGFVASFIRRLGGCALRGIQALAMLRMISAFVRLCLDHLAF
jgi:hypothetical protein